MTKRGTNLVGQEAFGFAAGPFPPDLLRAVKHELTRLIKRKGSRAELAEHLTRVCEEAITEAQLNNWTAESKPHVPPIHIVAEICNWGGDWRPVAALLNPYNQHIIDDKHRALMEYGEVWLEEQELKKKKDEADHKVRRAFLGGGQ